ncbi:MAG: type IV toxin-antitoxin system AbiEi family antitoxin domain-containing protein [Hydrogenophaga sp.]|jgi:predicted transcriptional regulator of viral defense system|uniref:type IV toxin-antitoxin system AbiEi family antitoxin domain-containing protein n=1 Tax=Hydrogenophaga sp. TaxID=1904254 RepID=UPI002715C363|nr:type IV toxin-antitoxin system AbiEi family antitoxin domain-containing protein [Hydrogenophaga sp.]MDO9569588.1 type IV toxin-antitoxin system AbiEi family antitoxin domain-containing protein [Hydrogenophaga sp.]MDP3375756.1 type IV toxin-antitoxin system AbiEi family antitoxin domain-containing protein [Hydrogenophaga sp.]
MSQSDHILELARHQRVLCAADVREHGWAPQLLLSLHQAGKLQRVARGLYSLPDAEITEHQTLIEVCQRVPKAVLCLLSALQFHGIGTQMPHEVWVALPQATHTPALDYPLLRITRLRGVAYSEGIQTVTEHGAPIRVYSVAKTVTDCFKFRNKIGLDVALEALKECWHSRRVTMAELNHFAKINRVERVMQPYLEAVVA